MQKAIDLFTVIVCLLTSFSAVARIFDIRTGFNTLLLLLAGILAIVVVILMLLRNQAARRE